MFRGDSVRIALHRAKRGHADETCAYSQNGDLTRPIETTSSLHQFHFVPKLLPERHGYAEMKLRGQLELGVGGNGVIGRRISIFQDAAMSVRLAEGVVGWN